MGPLHHFDNELGGSSTGMRRGGLTPFGREVVHRLEQREILIDLAHASPQTIRDVAAMATRPLVISHTGVKGTCDRARNINGDRVPFDVTGIVQVIDALLAAGFNEEQIARILGGNLIRLLQQSLPGE